MVVCDGHFKKTKLHFTFSRNHSKLTSVGFSLVGCAEGGEGCGSCSWSLTKFRSCTDVFLEWWRGGVKRIWKPEASVDLIFTFSHAHAHNPHCEYWREEVSRLRLLSTAIKQQVCAYLEKGRRCLCSCELCFAWLVNGVALYVMSIVEIAQPRKATAYRLESLALRTPSSICVTTIFENMAVRMHVQFLKTWPLGCTYSAIKYNFQNQKADWVKYFLLFK